MTHRVPSWIRSDGKLEIIKSVWDGRTPFMLWYYLGFWQSIPSRIEMVSLIDQFFFRPSRIQGDWGLVVYDSWFLPGEPLALQVVGSNVLNFPMEITVRNKVCPLYAVGEQYQEGYINFYDPSMSEGDGLVA